MSNNPIDILKEREARRAALAARMKRFGDDRETALPQVKEAAFQALIASALVQAEEECDCNAVGCWLETEIGSVSVVARRSPDPQAALVAAAQLADRGIDVTDFRLFNAQRRDFLLAAVNPPKDEGDSNPHADTSDPATFNFTDLKDFASFPTEREQLEAKRVLQRLSQGLSDEEAEAVAQGLPTPIPELDEDESLTAASYESRVGFPFKGTKNQVLQYAQRVIDLAARRKARKELLDIQQNTNRALIAWENATYRTSGIKYYQGLKDYLSSTQLAHPSFLDPNIGAWNRMLRKSMGPELLAHADTVVGVLRGRDLPIPDKKTLNKIIKDSVQEALADSKELLQTVERFRGGFATYDPTGIGHATGVAQSFGQRLADRIERKIVQDGVEKGLLQPRKRWTSFSKDSRHAYLDGQERPLDGTFRLEEGAPGPGYLGPRDPRMDAQQGSLSKSYLRYQPTRAWGEELAAEYNKGRETPYWTWEDLVTFWL